MAKKRKPTMAEIRNIAIASANADTVLVGGVAVSVLAEFMHIKSDKPCMTDDVDFMGGQLAIEASERLLHDFTVRPYFASFDDVNTPNSGKLVVEVDDTGQVEPVEIDFLSSVSGLSTDEIEQKAVDVEINGKRLKAIHPLLLLENKIYNLSLYPKKRNEAGINQAGLAISIARKYLSNLATGNGNQRALLNAIERVARLANRDGACFVYCNYGLDVLSAVPVELVDAEDFHNKRWPQINEQVSRRRNEFKRLLDRMHDAGKDPLTER